MALTLTTELDKETHPISEDLILEDFLHKWLTTFKVHEVCSRTMELYYSSERLHIVPVLGNCTLDAVTPPGTGPGADTAAGVDAPCGNAERRS